MTNTVRSTPLASHGGLSSERSLRDDLAMAAPIDAEMIVSASPRLIDWERPEDRVLYFRTHARLAYTYAEAMLAARAGLEDARL